MPVPDSVGRVAAAMNLGTRDPQVGLDKMASKFMPKFRKAALDLPITLLNLRRLDVFEKKAGDLTDVRLAHDRVMVGVQPDVSGLAQQQARPGVR
ncbi:hypothetical protein AWB65_05382 [Caballeronia humi]|uniref:Uncharacterized protein n=1 Tax=Caballeronia humi TaxID=326474 RepID=A0A158IUB9_9BURK|nr:hypothetical protein AWB65_05382 [Caballeronia humi]